MRTSRIVWAICLIPALGLSSRAAAESPGAKIIVTKRDGTQAQGLLTAVKWNTVVVSPPESLPGEALSIAVEDLGQVQIVKTEKRRNGRLWGTLIGAGVGTLVGLAISKRHTEASDISSGPSFRFNIGSNSTIAAISGLLLGGLVGLGVGAGIDSSGAGEILRFDGMTKEERNATLLRLSEYASLKGVR